MEILHYQAQTLVELAYKAIKKDITERALFPGQKIIVREMSEKYGISETPVKQALNRLIAEGLVESIPRRGVRVRELKWEEVAELMEIRFMIETYYISQVMETFAKDPKVRDKFLENITEHKAMIERISDVDEYFKNYYLDQEFHQLFVKCSENKRIIQIYNSLGTHAYAYYVYGKQDRAGMIKGVGEHETIYRALMCQDEKALRHNMEIHIVNAKNNVYQMLQKGDPRVKENCS